MLNLNYNNLQYLPDKMAELTQLETLYIYFNNITRYPKVLNKLDKLTIVKIYDNSLKTIDERSNTDSNSEDENSSTQISEQARTSKATVVTPSNGLNINLEQIKVTQTPILKTNDRGKTAYQTPKNLSSKPSKNRPKTVIKK